MTASLTKEKKAGLKKLGTLTDNDTLDQSKPATKKKTIKKKIQDNEAPFMLEEEEEGLKKYTAESLVVKHGYEKLWCAGG